MKSKRPKKPSEIAATTSCYGQLLAGIKQRIATAQVRAHLAVSRELNLLYWQIGRDIVERQKREGWGRAVIERLAADIQAAFPGIEGFSANNVWRMRAFYLAFEAEGPILAQPATELPPPEILSIPWFHNVIIIQKIKDPSTRLWYAAKTLENGWSRSILTLQIESAAHKRHGKAITNFKHTLPDPQSDLAQQIVKDPYHFGFLTLGLLARERELELGLMEHLTKAIGVSEYGTRVPSFGKVVHFTSRGNRSRERRAPARRVAALRATRPVAKRGAGYAKLVKAISQVNTGMADRAAVAVNQALVLRNWLIGSYIVEFEQNGADRAKYGARLLETLAVDLKAQAIKGLGAEVLRTCRLFFLSYPGISQTLSGKFELSPELTSISQTVSGKLGDGMSQPAIGRSALAIRQTLSAESPTPLPSEILLRFSWSHLQELIAIDDPWKRAFFENECLLANWSVRQLRRQIGSLLYERTGLSTNKKAVIEKARKQERQQDFTAFIRDPYVLEFTGLAERPEYLESDLESALLTHLQGFLLELGAGFCFEARQKRITVGRQHDYIDLVFYHRRLRCHVLIDLKIRPFKHGDAGQMNFYLNWWKANAVEEGDNPPVGIILCSDRDEAAVEFATAGMDQKLFVSRYLVALPSVEKLRRFLEADRERIESQMPPPATRKRTPRKPKNGLP